MGKEHFDVDEDSFADRTCPVCGASIGCKINMARKQTDTLAESVLNKSKHRQGNMIYIHKNGKEQ